MRLSKPLLALLAVVVCGPFASAQQMVIGAVGASPVVIESAEVHTEITGRLAVTTFDLTFRNPNARVLEGTFEFPLLPGQTVVRFALDVNGHLREAVPIEKERGRVVLEQIERRGIDPGLLEQTAGNNYRARVYPIPMLGTRRVVIAYQEDVGRSREALYRLPLRFESPVSKFRLVLDADTGATTSPKVRASAGLELPDWRHTRTIEVSRENFATTGVLELELPPATRPSVVTQQHDGADYFYAEVPLAKIPLAERPAPRVLGLLWDASGSARERDHGREWALLDAWFHAVPDVEVHVYAVRDRVGPAKVFRVHAGAWRGLRSYLETLYCDGATSFDGLADDPAVGEWMLFSDGLINYGASIGQRRLPLRAPVHAVLASTSADATRLRSIARQSGGEYVDLLEVGADAAVRRLRTRSLRVLAVEHDPEAVAEIYPERGEPIDAETMVVTGRLMRGAAALTVRVGHDASDAVDVSLQVKAGENPGDLAAHAWAAAKIEQLSVDPVANAADIRRTATAYGIVTPNTSLIVLESVMDYVRYDIAPPPELRDAWQQMRRTRADEAAKIRSLHLDSVAQEFAERTQWWEQHFPKDKPKLKKEVTGQPRPLAATTAMPPPNGNAPEPADAQENVQLSPFSVQTNRDVGYQARSTLAGTRTRGLADVAMAITGRASDAASEGPASTIALQPWQPQAGYLDRLRRAAREDQVVVYREERATHSREPGFYLDVAGFFFERGSTDEALTILSNLAELALEDAPMLRVLANRLVEAGHPELAKPLLERVLTLRPEEPQSRRDLALVCAALHEDQRAVDLLWEVVSRDWDSRFPDIELIALGEMNAIIARAGTAVDTSKIDRRLLRNLAVGLRAVLTWDADACDMDLWVDDPNGERAIYNHPRTYQGGRMSSDFTRGYGPEEFLLRDPKPGKYTIRINYYGDTRQTVLGPVTAQVRLITGFGTPQEKERRLTVRVTERQEQLKIGTIDIQ